ncbi:glutamine--fructose-6-phosphate transaminase (isomerizing) [Candidatus Deianiraea vastatrix]|uniref:Glutamine--fructose-6-phosphate aminotransferase [isomerizing] n=1 Tax=Candidatus Deianiraea vastatrix TaxID=2163644 RepID=A0A5B8XHF8_9RICK|nr:glutamine--fructose-6-phosphate transaminase (isomerizing) [Candidatus Deianiraea vastatrix]QED23531.1 Glutamine--fructose-6-phosphate aminotransferase [isomerizing] [Candidatus Deianiraea vastatrix]
MCGVIALMKHKGDVVVDILQSLQRLEYRGYDSCGIAVANNAKIQIVKETGKVENLVKSCKKANLNASIGMGHTRWATHGSVTTENAHPHTSGEIAVVHNGIIENYMEIKNELLAKGFTFKSQTDTETIPVLIDSLMKDGNDFKTAFTKAISRLKGAFAIIAICASEKNTIAVAKNQSPLVVGFGDNLSVVGSDAFSIISITNKMSYLLDGDYGFVSLDKGLELFDKNGEKAIREVIVSQLNLDASSKNGYAHYMLKEIHEQPSILSNIVKQNFTENGMNIENFDKIDFTKYKRIAIIACGTSYYAGTVCVKYFEQYAKMSCDCYIASEFRYRAAIIDKETLYIGISQSGETADVIGAIKNIKNAGSTMLSVINARETTMQFLSDSTIGCEAGPEIGVASTKVFTAQIMTILSLTLAIAQTKKLISLDEIAQIKKDLLDAISKIQSLLNDKSWIKNIAQVSKNIKDYSSILYLGRDISYALATEAALKMKELTYIHCEALASGELKHGSIALIDKNIPVVAIAPSSCLFDKSASNIEGIFSRDGRIVLVSDKAGIDYFAKFTNQILGSIEIPETKAHTMPFLYAPAAQLMSYHAASQKGHDVDQPRNLAKSVTVE